MDSKRLQQWFVENKRAFPWRGAPSPYAVWVSEVMLQQTQAAVVVPYFERWMEQFPTVTDLAQAPLDVVIKAWEGLGYYSRARNLHAGAKQVVEHHGGDLPSTYEELKAIKGLGPYTIGAILSFAFHKKAVAVDGNVMRVLSRLLMIEEDISKPSTLQHMRHTLHQLLPEDESWVVNEALIELGATICTRQAQCVRCPLQGSCKALSCGAVDRLPYKSRAIPVQPLHRVVMVLQAGDYLLVQRRQEGEIMSDLHEFPFMQLPVDEEPDHADVMTHIASQFGLEAQFLLKLPTVKHSFTRYRAQLVPMLFECPSMPLVPGSRWMHRQECAEAAFSSGHKRILKHVQEVLR